MSSSRLIMIAVAILMIASLACSGTSSTPTPVPPTQPPPTKAPPPKPPTDTPKPVPPTTTPRPTQPPLPPGVLFLDDFTGQQASEANGWSFEPGDSVDRAWSPGKLTISIMKEQWLGLNWPNGNYDDYGVEVEVQAESDPADYGILFRIRGGESSRSYYLYGVTTDGKYYLDAFVDGQWADTSPVKAKSSQYIKKGKVKNTLGVLTEWPKISLYINGFLVETVSDDTLEGGQVGVFAGTGKYDSAKVSFSRFTVLTADKAKAEWGTTPAVGGGGGGGGGAQPTATTAAGGGGGGGTGNGVMVVSNSFPGACQANLWGQQEATIRAEGNSSASKSLPPGLYGAHLAVDIGEVDLSYQIYLPPGGRCTLVCDAGSKSVYVTPASCRR